MCVRSACSMSERDEVEIQVTRAHSDLDQWIRCGRVAEGGLTVMVRGVGLSLRQDGARWRWRQLALPLWWAAFGIAELGGGLRWVVDVGGRGPWRSGPERVDRVEGALEDAAVGEAGGRAEDHASAGAHDPRGDREQQVA